MNPKAKGSPCYFCGDPSTSLEHIPPEQIFVGFSSGEITVPSCQLHNEAKSRFDDCILKGFLWGIHGFLGQGLPALDVHPNIVKVIDRVKDRFPQVKKDVQYQEIFLEGEHPKNPGVKAVTVDARIDFNSWIKKVTAGLIWDATQKYHPELDWVEQCIVHNNFYIPSSDPSKKLKKVEWNEHIASSERLIEGLDSCKWIPGWSAFPNPYPAELYQFKLGYSQAGTLWFFHRFFRHYKFYVGVKAPQELAEKIGIHCDAREFIYSLVRSGEFSLRGMNPTGNPPPLLPAT